MEEKQKVEQIVSMANSGGWKLLKGHINNEIKFAETELLENEELDLTGRIALQKERKCLIGILGFVKKRVDKFKNN